MENCHTWIIISKWQNDLHTNTSRSVWPILYGLMIKMLQYKMYPAGELAVLRQLLLFEKNALFWKKRLIWKYGRAHYINFSKSALHWSDICLYDTSQTNDYSLWQMSYDNEYFIIASDKRGVRKLFFLFLHENICCGYSLEVPQKHLLLVLIRSALKKCCGYSLEVPQKHMLWVLIRSHWGTSD